MRALQILFLITFAILALVIPYFVFSSMTGESNYKPLIILIAVIFVINAIFIGRKLINMKNNKRV